MSVAADGNPRTVEELLAAALMVETSSQLIDVPRDARALHVARLDDLTALLLSEFRNLRAISSGGNSTISDAGVRHLATIRTLEALDLEWCSEITDEALNALGELPGLRWLDVSFCSRLTSAGIERFSRAHPQCAIERDASG